VVANEEIKTCAGCGASVYKEHLDRGTAGYWAGQLLCNICLAERGQGAPGRSLEDDLAPIRLEEPIAAADVRPATSTDSVAAQQAVHDDSAYKRPLIKGPAASRCRSFHCKLSDGALAYMSQQITEWCDANPEIQIKFCTSAIGMFEAKQHQEPHLILTCFY
jgi:hypothetical protein